MLMSKSMELKFLWRYKNYELRACPKRLVKLNSTDINTTIDFVKWDTNIKGEKYCFSLAYWERSKDGYKLKFVGNRPFKHINNDDLKVIWKAMKTAQMILDNWFKLTEQNA